MSKIDHHAVNLRFQIWTLGYNDISIAVVYMSLGAGVVVVVAD
jgi:hypothetical protein